MYTCLDVRGDCMYVCTRWHLRVSGVRESYSRMHMCASSVLFTSPSAFLRIFLSSFSFIFQIHPPLLSCCGLVTVGAWGVANVCLAMRAAYRDLCAYVWPRVCGCSVLSACVFSCDLSLSGVVCLSCCGCIF